MRKNPDNEPDTKYPGRISFYSTAPMVGAIAGAAQARMTSMNAWLREAALHQLRAEGRKLPKETEAA